MLSVGFLEEFCSVNVCAGVKGCLKSSVSFWHLPQALPNSVTLDTISYGDRLPFDSYPASFFLSNNSSALRHPGFIVHASIMQFQSFWTMAVLRRKVSLHFVLTP